MGDIDKLANSISMRIESAKQAQIRFVECVSVDWDNKTMDAVGTGDGVEYLDVTLGYGFMDIKPKTGTTCLIGIVEGSEVVTFLIDAEDVELVEIKSDNIVFNGGENLGIVKVKELTAKVNTLEKDLNAVKAVFSAWVPPVAPAIDNGAALKLALTNWIAQQIPVTQVEEISDNKITH
jgi:hypothetical protein